MIVFSSSNFCMIFANLLTVSKVLVSYASFPSPKRSGHSRTTGFTNFATLQEDEFQGFPAKSVQTESQQPAEMTVFRLPTHIRPRSYALKMVIDRDKLEFSGEAKIDVNVSRNSDTVLLHSHLLKIDEVALYHKNSEIATSFVLDPANQLLRILTNSTLLSNEFYEIQIKFAGKLDADLQGIYRSANYIGSTTKHIAVTQFEPTQAREAFPCFDEPHFRATFNIRLARYQNEIALSNMPQTSTSEPDPSVDNRVWNTYDPTPPMPSYLVAFNIVDDFTYISDPTGKYKLWAAKDKIEDYRYAHTALEKAVKSLEEYTGIEYPLPSLQLVVVEDFRRAAMENWGLMTFKAILVRFKKSEDELWKQHHVLVLVVHETIHQWFGNYVTIKWWDSLWLKEGMATLFSYIIGASVDPFWRLADIFIHEIKMRALEVDGTTENTPMTHPVNSPAEIEKQFNPINYDKAASVLHMLRFIVSPATFQKAIHMYLRTGYTAGGGVTSPDDLWAAFDHQLLLENRSLGNGLTVGQTMKSWTHQIAYPIITVSRHANGSRADISFKQDPFFPAHEPANGKTPEWIVPLTCAKGSNPDFNDTQPKLWLLDRKEVILHEEVGTDEWIVCNVQQTGYYRLNYDEKSWKLISDVLSSSPEKIHPYNRQQIFHDVFNSMQTRRVSPKLAFQVIRTLDHEKDVLVWIIVTQLVDKLLWDFEGTEAYDKLQKFFKKRYQRIYENIGFHERPTDAEDVRNFRSHLLKMVCELGFADCLSKAAAEFNKHDTIDRMPSYLQYAAIGTALKFNSSSDLTWEKLRYYFKKQQNPQDNDKLADTFGSLQDESTIKKFLTDMSVNKMDKLEAYSLENSLSHYHGMMAAMRFILDMLPKMSEYRAGETLIKTILNSTVVRSHGQVNLLNEMLQTAMKLDSEKYENIIKILNVKKRESETQVQALDELSSQILVALDSTPRDLDAMAAIRPSIAYTWRKKISAAESLGSHTIFCLIFTSITWFLSNSLGGLKAN